MATGEDKTDVVETCGTCIYSFNATADQMMCRANPPTPVIVNIMHPVTREAQPSIQGIYPPIAKNGWCGMYDDGDATPEKTVLLS